MPCLVVGIDFSAASEAALGHSLSLVNEGDQVHLVAVGADVDASDDYRAELTGRMKGRLQELAKTSAESAPGVVFNSHAEFHANPCEVLLRLAASSQADGEFFSYSAHLNVIADRHCFLASTAIVVGSVGVGREHPPDPSFTEWLSSVVAPVSEDAASETLGSTTLQLLRRSAGTGLGIIVYAAAPVAIDV